VPTKTGFPILAAKVGKSKVLSKKEQAFRPFFYKTDCLCKLYTPLYMSKYALAAPICIAPLLLTAAWRRKKRIARLTAKLQQYLCHLIRLPEHNTAVHQKG
jgi:hypothetical protein